MDRYTRIFSTVSLLKRIDCADASLVNSINADIAVFGLKNSKRLLKSRKKRLARFVAWISSASCSGSMVCLLVKRSQSFCKKRFVPSSPASCHSQSSSGGPINKMYRRKASVPYFCTISSGLTMLPTDFDIFST